MKRFLLPAVAMAALFTLAGVQGQTTDTTPPNTRFQTPLNGQTVTPDANGLVHFRARADDAGGIRLVTLTVPNGSASFFPTNAPKWAIVRAAWDTRESANGPYEAKCTAIDVAGNVKTVTITVTLRK